MSFTIDTKALERACMKAANVLPLEAAKALETVADAALASMVGTTSFNDRTGALRKAFDLRGSRLAGTLTVGVNPNALGRIFAGRKGRSRRSLFATPPGIYSRFLEWGTRSISPRRFGFTARTDALEVARDEFAQVVTRALR